MNQLSQSGSINRRQFLAASAAAAASCAITPYAARGAAPATPALIKGKAEHCIFVWLGGGMGQIDTFDPKRRGDPVRKVAGSYTHIGSGLRSNKS